MTKPARPAKGEVNTTAQSATEPAKSKIAGDQKYAELRVVVSGEFGGQWEDERGCEGFRGQSSFSTTSGLPVREANRFGPNTEEISSSAPARARPHIFRSARQAHP